MNHTQHRLKGVLFAIIGATLWGLGGTAFAFYLFIDSLKYLSPKETTLLGTIEPVIAVVTSALWSVLLQSVQVIGIVLILILILMLSLKKQPEEM